MNTSDIFRFLSKFKIVESGCWEWQTGLHKDGYGLFFLETHSHLAHRVSYEIFVGPLGEFHALHDCDNPKCVNPMHLYAGTHQQNMKDRDNRGRRKSPKGELNPKAKLTWKEVREIRDLVACGLFPCTQIGKMYDIHSCNVYDIRDNRIWREENAAS